MLDAQAAFFDALRSGDAAALAALWDDEAAGGAGGGGGARDVEDALALGARLDPWPSVLAQLGRDGPARFEQRDALVLPAPPGGGEGAGEDAAAAPREASSTAIVVPGGGGATLLATQRWRRSADDRGWRLRLHTTIPFEPGARGAAATLRCDARGCVALARVEDKVRG